VQHCDRIITPNGGRQKVSWTETVRARRTQDDDKEQLPHLLTVSESRSIIVPLSHGSLAIESRLQRLASYQTLSEKQWPDGTLYSTQSVQIQLGGSD